MARLKVSIDEWAVLNYASLDDGFCIWTDGLSGCVGVAIAAGPRVFLTHVSSDMNDGNKAEYLKKLQLGLNGIGPAPKVTKVRVVLGGDSTTEVKRGCAVADHIYQWLFGDAFGPESIFDGEPEASYSGVVARVLGGGARSWELSTQRNLGDPTGSSAPTLNTETGSPHFEAYGTLVNFKGAAAV